MKENSNPQSGFTLVELAIVIVVIALLVVIVAAGKSLISAGKVRAVLKEIEETQASIVRFQDKYADLPGDMQDAFSYWGSNCATNATDCNGDGNEQIVWDENAADNTYHEGAMALKHLQLANMLGGELVTGKHGWPKLGENMVGSKVPNAGWTIDYGTSYNFLQLGAQPLALGSLNTTPVLEPKDSFSIDDKLDDGDPTTGRVLSFPIGATACYNGIAYNLNVTQKACYMTFRLDTEL